MQLNGESIRGGSSASKSASSTCASQGAEAISHLVDLDVGGCAVGAVHF